MTRLVTLIMICVIAFISGCSKESPPDTYDQERKESDNNIEIESNSNPIQKLRIMTAFTVTKEYEKQFDQMYGNAFRKEYPNIQLEWLRRSSAKPFLESAEEEEWDVMISFSDKDYRKLVQDGMLKEIGLEFMDVGRLHPPVIAYLLALGNGKLYGLTDQFRLAGLKFNKELFDRYDVDYPTNGMTWDEVFQLAKKFPRKSEGEKKQYGLYHSYTSAPFNMVNDLRKSYGLSYVDGKGDVNLRSAAWRHMLSLALDAYVEGYIPPPTNGEYGLLDLSQQDIAMEKIDRFLHLDEKYGIVTEPVGSHTKPVTSFLTGLIFSISAYAKHPVAAEQFMRFVNSEEVAQNNLGRIYNLPARTYLIPETEQVKLAPFFTRQVNVEELLKDDQNTIQFDYDQLLEAWKEAFVQYINQKIQIDELIAILEAETKKAITFIEDGPR